MVGQIGFEPTTNGYLQLQNFVTLPKGSQHTHSGLLLEPIVIPGYTTTPTNALLHNKHIFKHSFLQQTYKQNHNANSLQQQHNIKKQQKNSSLNYYGANPKTLEINESML